MLNSDVITTEYRCSNPPEVLNTTWHMPPGKIGLFAKYMCMPGMHPVGGSSNITCLGPSGWTEVDLLCKGKCLLQQSIICGIKCPEACRGLLLYTCIYIYIG